MLVYVILEPEDWVCELRKLASYFIIHSISFLAKTDDKFLRRIQKMFAIF